MKYFTWNVNKNKQLKVERDVSFEEVVVCIEEGKLMDILEHSNKEKYGNQNIFVIELNNYVYLVTFVEEEEYIFLKTIIPSRKATKKYLKR